MMANHFCFQWIAEDAQWLCCQVCCGQPKSIVGRTACYVKELTLEIYNSLDHIITGAIVAADEYFDVDHDNLPLSS